jgi:hypothetical protein
MNGNMLRNFEKTPTVKPCPPPHPPSPHPEPFTSRTVRPVDVTPRPRSITLDLAARLGVLRQSGNEVRTDTLCGHLVFDGSARRLACGDILCAYPDCDNEHLDHCGDCRAVVLSS